jgi:hypothetical protein
MRIRKGALSKATQSEARENRRVDLIESERLRGLFERKRRAQQ